MNKLAYVVFLSVTSINVFGNDDLLNGYPMQLLWGDTHVHSSYSMDANATGNTRLSPAEAYRFARGEEVVTNTDQKAKLSSPLDFLVVADHAEYMGLLPMLRSADPILLQNAKGKKLYEEISSGDVDRSTTAIIDLLETLVTNEPMIDNEAMKAGIWDKITATADEYNSPGVFTALIGYEWSSMPAGDNLHRVVIYRDDANKAAQRTPVSAFDGDQPEDLWRFMSEYEQSTGGKILAIPHNANLSNGRMFAVEKSNGKPIDRSYAVQRSRWEPLVEVTQMKGDAETHPLLSPDDKFADFETWDIGNIRPSEVTPKKPEMLEFEYARSALKLGLDLKSKTGVNPFKFGMLGSTDSHTSLSTAAEDNFWGKLVMMEPGVKSRNGEPARTNSIFLTANKGKEFELQAWRQVASGYTGVWAKENSRESIFDAMQRKEVYATTGSRIAVRFFGGWELVEDDLYVPDPVSNAYRKAVPMGADLPQKNVEEQGPSFVVMAMKDPRGANLDRIQIIKGWRDSKGDLQESIYDVATSGVSPIESAVKGVAYNNRVGATSLQAYWQDPDFNVKQPAFYYARVLEIPKPRWTAYDKERLGAELIPGTVVEIQDRAYTSPIWYEN